eukprot:TRINITY_DN8683_c0_g1_i2.p1 TRINITY_DN8683_c0_g1~~TRINITY_DN8683_c0_g1_i2.p1  ORF type:complete len:1039 (+),score=298.95 TRINITY_DN8683_c0_g1_i2:104-3220(+)
MALRPRWTLVAETIKSGKAAELLRKAKQEIAEEEAKEAAMGRSPRDQAFSAEPDAATAPKGGSRRSVVLEDDWNTPPRSRRGPRGDSGAKEADESAMSSRAAKQHRVEADIDAASSSSVTTKRRGLAAEEDQPRSPKPRSAMAKDDYDSPQRARARKQREMALEGSDTPSRTTVKMSEEAIGDSYEAPRTRTPKRSPGSEGTSPPASPPTKADDGDFRSESPFSRGKAQDEPEVYSRASAPRSQRAAARRAEEAAAEADAQPDMSPRSRRLLRKEEGRYLAVQRIPDAQLDGFDRNFTRGIVRKYESEERICFTVWKHHVRVQRSHMQTLLGKWIDSLNTLKTVSFKSWLTEMRNSRESAANLVEHTSRIMQKMVEKRCQALDKSINQRNGERAAEFAAHCFELWGNFTKAEKIALRAKDKARKAALAKYNMMGQDLATHVFISWRDHTHEVAEEKYHNAETMKLCLIGWHAIVHDKELKRQMQDRALHNMAHAMNVATEALVAQIVVLWSGLVKEAELRKQRDEEVFKRFAMKFDMGQDALISACFSCWAKDLEKFKADARKEAEAMAKVTLLLGVHNHGLLQLVVQVWGQVTQDHIKQAKEAQQQKLDHIRAFMAKMGLQADKFIGVVFHSWCERMRKEHEQTLKMRAMSVKMGLQTEALMALIIQSWNADLKKMAMKRDKENTVMKSMLTKIGLQQTQLLELVYMEWKLYTKESAADRENRQKVYKKTMMNIGLQNDMLLATILEHWDIYVKEEMMKREVEQKDKAHADEARRQRIALLIGKKDEHLTSITLRAWDLVKRERMARDAKHNERMQMVQKHLNAMGVEINMVVMRAWSTYVKDVIKKEKSSKAMQSSLEKTVKMEMEIFLVHTFHLWHRYLYEEIRRKDRDDSVLKSIVQRLGMESSHLKIIVYTAWRFVIEGEKTLGLAVRSTKDKARMTWLRSMTGRNNGNDQEFLMVIMKCWSTLTLSEVEKADLLSQFVGQHVNSLVALVKSPHREMGSRLHQRALHTQLMASGDKSGIDSLRDLHAELKGVM